jgi:hypothetical protein
MNSLKWIRLFSSIYRFSKNKSIVNVLPQPGDPNIYNPFNLSIYMLMSECYFIIGFSFSYWEPNSFI